MGIFGGGNNNSPTREFQTRVNQSALGMPFPAVMGTAQVQQTILWIDGFKTTKESSSSGGKGGGGKGGSFYLYSADVVAALCNGPIKGIGDVWSGQSWLGNPNAFETYVISGAGTYTPTNASSLVNDNGVSVSNSYSGTYNDYGAPSSTVLSGTDQAALLRVSYGSTLATGQYSINPSTGVYNFNNSTDLGKTVQLSYSYSLTNINQEETDIVPAGKQIMVGTGFPFASDLGVTYPLTGVALTKVTGTPSVTGTYSVSGSNPATYKFATGDISAEVRIKFSITDTNAVGQGQPTQLNYTLHTGTAGQTPFSFLTASYPGAALGFTNLATILYQPMDLATSAQIQQNRFEVITPDVFGGGIADCNPVTCLTQVLTNGQWGLGVGTTPFPASVIDNGVSGTWGGSASSPGTRTTNSTAWNWFAAQNFFISPVIDGQDTTASVASKWLEAGMCAAFMSEGLLKLVPYGDTSAAANGYTWTAPSNFVAALDDSCFLEATEGEDPVKINRSSPADAWNAVQIQWDNRSNQYSPEVTQESDQGSINRWGERREDPQNWDFIHTLSAATFAANMRVKRNVYIRNTYEFSLPYSYSYLEPMDVCTISTTSVWAQGLNNANLGVTNLPVRIHKIVDDPEKGLHITCEDYPFGAHAPVLYNKQISNGDVAVNLFADPGSAEIVMFEATSRMTGYAGNEIWIGANGAGDNYGSTNILVSSDGGTTYKQIDTITAPARMGVLHSTFASGSDPDTTHSMGVDLVENCAAWQSGSTSDADLGNTLVFVDGEIISYSALTVTGQDQITMSSYIRRGQMNSTISSHSAGGLVLRLDNTIFKYQYDPTWAGKTLLFKFQAVNAFGNNPQELSALTPVSFTVPGINPGSIDASSGLLNPFANPNLYQGAYNGSTAYVKGNEVTYSGGYYKCIANTTGNLPTNTSYWQLVSLNTSVFDGAYNGSTAYVPGNQVTYGGSYYICIANTTGNLPTNATYWQLISTTNTSVFDGTYNGSTAYVPGNQVTYNGSYWICISNSTGNAPSTTSSFWTLVGTSAILIGAYDPSVAYVVGNQVTYNGNIFQALQATTGNAPPAPPATNAYWILVGLSTVDPSTGVVLAKGGIPPTMTTGFSYTATTSSITWSWTGLTIYRADGTTTSISNGSQAVTGLSSSTTYKFYPFYDDSTSTFGWVAGGVGSPAYAQTAASNSLAQQQNLQARIPASSGSMSAATTSSGSGGGSGGGSGTCLRADMFVETRERGRVYVADVEVGEHLACPDGWTEVVERAIRPQSVFVEVTTTATGQIVITPTHTLTLADGTEKPASALTLEDQVRTRLGVDGIDSLRVRRDDAFKVLVTCEPTHTFYAGKDDPAILAHNLMAFCD